MPRAKTDDATVPLKILLTKNSCTSRALIEMQPFIVVFYLFGVRSITNHLQVFVCFVCLQNTSSLSQALTMETENHEVRGNEGEEPQR